jgi:hypothetical protein
VKKKIESRDISDWLNHFTIEELQKMGLWAPVEINETNIYNGLRLKKKGLNSIELTIPLDIVRNPNYPEFLKWKAGSLVRFYIVDKNMLLITLEDYHTKTVEKA